jgi:hypothetical protein
MPYEFTEFEPEPEPLASGRFSGPPRKMTGIGILDPPVPPKRSPGRIPSERTRLFWRVAAALILASIVAMTFFLLFAKH